jgi:hypothetical protein
VAQQQQQQQQQHAACSGSGDSSTGSMEEWHRHTVSCGQMHSLLDGSQSGQVTRQHHVEHGHQQRAQNRAQLLLLHVA